MMVHKCIIIIVGNIAIYNSDIIKVTELVKGESGVILSVSQDVSKNK